MLFSELGEFALIARLRELVPADDPDLRLGIGDDAAVWTPGKGRALCLSCDAQVEGRHFLSLQGATSSRWAQVGRRSAHANLSDLAAMAAKPRFALISLGLPAETPVEGLEALYRGLVEAMTQAGATIVGGNITAVSGPLWIDVTVGGEVEEGREVRRTGAREGDWLAVTGAPGSAAAGLQLLLADSPVEAPLRPLVEAYLSPTARWREARSVAHCLRAMTDLSDGLWMDLANLIPPGLGLSLRSQDLPYSKPLLAWCKRQGEPLWEALSQPSDDYELAMVVPEEHKEEVKRLSSRWPCRLQWLGRLKQQEEPLVWVGEEGVPTNLRRGGWEHGRG